jgi:hypothetical protein
MTMPETETIELLTVSPTQLESLRSGHAAWNHAIAAATEAEDKAKAAKTDRDDKVSSFREAVDGIPVDEEPTKQQEHQIAGLSRDLRRAEQKHVECDREKRSRADHEKKMGDRFVKIAIEIAEGKGDLFSVDVEASDTWKGVRVADFVSDLHAMQFVKAGLHTAGDVVVGYDRLKKLVSDGEITKDNMAFVTQAIADTMHSRGQGRHLPEGMRKLVGKDRKAIPEVVKEKAAKPDASVAGESGEQ